MAKGKKKPKVRYVRLRMDAFMYDWLSSNSNNLALLEGRNVQEASQIIFDDALRRTIKGTSVFVAMDCVERADLADHIVDAFIAKGFLKKS